MKFLSKLFPISIICLAITGIIWLQQKTLIDKKHSSTTIYAADAKSDELFLETQARLPQMGFGNLLADWTFLRFIQYFGDSPAREATGHTLTPHFFQIVVNKDPRFIQALLMLSSANSMYAFQPKTTVKLLNQALTQITPKISDLSPYVWSYKGIDEMLFLGDNKSSQHSYEMAAQWALEQGGKDAKAVADRNQQTANFLAKNPDSKKARVFAWMSIMENALDDKVRKQAFQEIRALGGKVGVTPQGNLVITFPEKD
jgi:hypothetical protein